MNQRARPDISASAADSDAPLIDTSAALAEGPTEDEDELTVKGRAAIYHVFCIDIAYLIQFDGTTKKAITDLIYARADGSIQKKILHGGVDLGTFVGSISELEEIEARGQRAKEAEGKFIWSPTILKREAPFAKPTADGRNFNWVSNSGQAVSYAGGPIRTRLFRRGTLSIVYKHYFDATSSDPLIVEDFIRSLEKLANDLRLEAETRFTEFLSSAGSSQHKVAGIEVGWREVDENAKSVIKQKTLQHSLIFLEAAPGQYPTNKDAPVLDVSDPEVQIPTAALLNSTWWHRDYDEGYVSKVFKNALRNRRDEVYLSDEKRSVVVLADFWKPGNSLEFYMDDLVLATSFELARISHVNYLSHYLNVAAPRVSVSKGTEADRRQALEFVQTMQDAVGLSGYDEPTESLVVHGFTQRFLALLASERKTDDSIKNMTILTDKIAQNVQIQATMSVAEKNLATARNTLILSGIVLFAAAAAIGVAVWAERRDDRVEIVEVPIPVEIQEPAPVERPSTTLSND